jgi:hypothetical protein
MQSGEYWRTLFENWPEVIERHGIVISQQGESIPFVNFLMSGGLLLLERSSPDAAGSRKIIVAFDSIALIKLTTTAELSRFQAMGFQRPV